jgi:hypothetical protein
VLQDDRDHLRTPATLRVGALLDGRRIPVWQLECLAAIHAASFCELVLFGPARSRPGSAGRPSARHLLYGAYERAERGRLAAADDPLARVDLDAGPLREVERVGIELSQGGPSRSAIERIERSGLDVLLCLAGAPALDVLARCADRGVWCLYLGASRGLPDEAPRFWETFGNDDLSITTLEIVDREGRQRVAYRATAATDPVSMHRNRRCSYRKAAQLPLRCLAELRRRGRPPRAEPDRSLEPGQSRRLKPTNLEMVRFLSRIGLRLVGNRLRDLLLEEQWYVAYRRRAKHPDVSAPFTRLRPPPGRFYADPFLIHRDGRHYLFFEDWDYAVNRGVISYVEIDESGAHSAPRVALDTGSHLSYPCLFGDGDAVYMLPETGQRGRVELYRAHRFPEGWERERVLIEDVDARDPTLIRHAGKLWLFVALTADKDAAADELFLFWSDSLGGRWQPHPLNPISSDVRSARPAGRLFADGERLIRPAQDCSRAYGWRVALREVERLDERGYRESPVGGIEPVGRWRSQRTHTYSADGLYEAVDGLRMRPRLPLPGFRWGEEHFRIELRPRLARLDDPDPLPLEPTEQRAPGLDGVKDVRV